MQFFTDLVVGFLTAYLAFTNTLAMAIDSLVSDIIKTTPSAIVLEKTPEDSNSTKDFTTLPNHLGQKLPDILLRSIDYQQAAVSETGDQIGPTTNNPLEAIVNIFCTLTTKKEIRTTTGTGFFIDPDGVIITNAHVAQFLLLEKTDTFGDASCIVRAGNPAAPQFLAELLYLSPAWMQSNAAAMQEATPMGTGERDYALLYVSKTINDQPLPASFPALAYSIEDLPVTIVNQSIVAAGYPATDFFRYGTSADLTPKQSTTTISELYTFGSNLADVFSIRGSSVGAEGSSGGPVLNEQGEVIGLIVTRSNDETDGAGSLRAITLSHVERTIKEETGFSLAKNLGGNLRYRAEVFGKTLSPFLISLLENQVE